MAAFALVFIRIFFFKLSHGNHFHESPCFRTTYSNLASSARLKLKHVQQLLSLFESLLTLLFRLFQWENKGLALLFCILQYLAMTWYVNDIFCPITAYTLRCNCSFLLFVFTVWLLTSFLFNAVFSFT